LIKAGKLAPYPTLSGTLFGDNTAHTLPNNAATSSNLPNNAATSSNPPDNAATSSNPPDNAATTSNPPDNAATTSTLPDNAVKSSNLPDNATNSALPDNALTLSDNDVTSRTLPPLDAERAMPIFACLQNPQSHKMNDYIIHELSRTLSVYKASNQTWKAMAYEKAIKIIDALNFKITDKNDLQKIKGLSKNMLNHIMEILDTGALASSFMDEQKTKVIESFVNIHGVAFVTAKKFWDEGMRTIADIEARTDLNPQQIIGLKYYYEFLEPIPRDQVQMIGDKVISYCELVDSSINVEIMGSFLRGKASCGDVDLLRIFI
jgi:hypothetical protein